MRLIKGVIGGKCASNFEACVGKQDFSKNEAPVFLHDGGWQTFGKSDINLARAKRIARVEQRR